MPPKVQRKSERRKGNGGDELVLIVENCVPTLNRDGLTPQTFHRTFETPWRSQSVEHKAVDLM
jgi:hypothetical protein